MKIQSEQSLAAAYRFKNENAVKGDLSQGSTSGNVTAGFDRVDLSGSSGQIQRLKTMMKQLPDSGAGKVAQLKAQIADGSYQAPSVETAGKMLASWRGLNVN